MKPSMIGRYLIQGLGRFHHGLRLEFKMESFLPTQQRAEYMTPADQTQTYLELVGPLRLRSAKRNGESDGNDEAFGEIHVKVSGYSLLQQD
jgi:hypothetical protein